MTVAIIVLLCLLSFLLIWQFAAYALAMALVAKVSGKRDKDYDFKPMISVIVPAYNESKVIKQRLQNVVALDYPKDKYEVVVVESGSADGTYEIARDFVDKLDGQSAAPTVRIVREEERKGKASAINYGAGCAKGDIVLVTDANSMFDEHVLKEIAPHFKDPKVGGCGGRFVVPNTDNDLAASASFYWDVECLMRRGESAIDSSCTFHGEINAWRKGLVRADTKMITEDLEMAVQIRRSGYRVRYEPDAIVYEPAATTSKDSIKQRKRTTLGTIQCTAKHWKYLMFPRDLYSLLIFPSHKILNLISPFLILGILILYLVAWNPEITLIHFLATAVVFILVVGALQVVKKSEAPRRAENKSKGGVKSLFKLVYYVLLNEYLILLAWKDYAWGKRSVLWEKAESTRQG
jgi:biofilm PGA synthesis N-glycosyltransferase PgaC